MTFSAAVHASLNRRCRLACISIDRLGRDNRPYDLKRRSVQDGYEAKPTKVAVLHIEDFRAFIFLLDDATYIAFVRTRYGMP
jgi:hypothetical protein